MKTSFLSLIFTVALCHSPAYADEPPISVAELMSQWAHVNYELQDDDQEQAFEALMGTAKDCTHKFPQDAEGHIWAGIIYSSFAGAKGGLGALGLAKQAKQELEYAIRLDGSALQGSAYTSLGTLYAQVPGWPIGFGDDDKAKELLQKSLQINPEGIDVNYFYAQFLYDEREYKEAKTYLLKAQAAPPRLARPLADKYRQQEISTLLAKVERKLRR